MVTRNELQLREQMLSLAAKLTWMHAKLPLTAQDLDEVDDALSNGEYEMHASIERIRKERNNGV
jgi:hypothetical protein